MEKSLAVYVHGAARKRRVQHNGSVKALGMWKERSEERMRRHTAFLQISLLIGFFALLASGCASTGKSAPSPLPPSPAAGRDNAAAKSSAEQAAQKAALETPKPVPAPKPAPKKKPAPPPKPVQVAAVAPPPEPFVERFPEVTLAQFTTGVENREPMDAVAFVGNDVAEIYFYSELRDLSGAKVTHRWEYEGEIVAEVPFDVSKDQWQAWSTKSLKPDQLGDWTVSVIAPDGEVLAVESFSYQPAR